MEWHKLYIAVDCSECFKEIRSGSKVGISAEYKTYCWHCGHNIELSQEHRFMARVDREALTHLRSI